MTEEFRCKNCRKLLAKGNFIGELSIVCPRCKVYNSFSKNNKTELHLKVAIQKIKNGTN